MGPCHGGLAGLGRLRGPIGGIGLPCDPPEEMLALDICVYYMQGCFFNCSAQISVLKRKTLFNQQGSFVHREFHGTEFLIGCPSFFILVLKIGRNS